MLINSRGLSLILSSIISALSTAFLTLVPTVLTTALIIAFGITFCASYILIRLVLEFLFFRHINDINEALREFSDKELSEITQTNNASFNPLKRINRDLTEYAANKQQEILELKKMETFRREFIADISHELKTPIFAAQGFVHTLLDGAIEDKKVRIKFLKKAAKSLDGLDILVQDLLTISQMETGEIKMHFESFNIVALAHEVVDQLEGEAEKREITVTFEGNAEVQHFVRADYQRIYQVLINLVSNGIKYTKKEGNVNIRFEEKDGFIITSIADNGRGIPPEDLKRIFERFYRVEKSRSKEKGGTGLGLSIVKHIMEGHGSTIEVTSTVGKGSTFSFKLKKGKKVAHRFVEEEDEDYA